MASKAGGSGQPRTRTSCENSREDWPTGAFTALPMSEEELVELRDPAVLERQFVEAIKNRIEVLDGARHRASEREWHTALLDPGQRRPLRNRPAARAGGRSNQRRQQRRPSSGRSRADRIRELQSHTLAHSSGAPGGGHRATTARPCRTRGSTALGGAHDSCPPAWLYVGHRASARRPAAPRHVRGREWSKCPAGRPRSDA